MKRPSTPLVIVGTFLLAACGETAGLEPGRATPAASEPGSTEPAGTEPVEVEVEVEVIESSPTEVTFSGLDAYRSGQIAPGQPMPLVDFEEIRSGGPPPDGIPPIDEPSFVDVADADFLTDNEPVLALEIDGDARAYPVQILTWHEIVNDAVGGVPVAVSYCPLCNSAIAYDRRLDDRVLDFGTSGLLYNSALVMYDRQTETLWSHFTGEGIVGEFTGRDLAAFPMSTVSWATFRDANPGGLVLSRETGFRRDYGRNPYPGYDDVDGVPFLFEGEVDGRYTALTRIVGVESDEAAVGIPLQDLQSTGVVTGEIAGAPLVALWTQGTASALDTATISAGDDVGATGVYVPRVGPQALTFTANDDGTFTDAETASTWDILGEAIDGALAGERLEQYQHVDTFWFAWSTFRPDTLVLTG